MFKAVFYSTSHVTNYYFMMESWHWSCLKSNIRNFTLRNSGIHCGKIAYFSMLSAKNLWFVGPNKFDCVFKAGRHVNPYCIMLVVFLNIVHLTHAWSVLLFSMSIYINFYVFLRIYAHLKEGEKLTSHPYDRFKLFSFVW